MEPLRQYDVVIARLASRARADEESLADLLNERARAGWRFHSMTSLGPTRVALVFERDTT
jgi:hypothetical protein